MLNGLWERTRNPRLCLGGGCAMNSVANGKIRERTPFRDVFVQPAAADFSDITHPTVIFVATSPDVKTIELTGAADPGAEYFAGKTIKIIVPNPAGGTSA